MPELPEVETIRRDLAVSLTGREIVAFHIFSPKSASHSAAFFKKSLVGRRIKEIRRRGKLLIFVLAPVKPAHGKNVPDYLLIHLKMTGQLIYIHKKSRIAGGHSLKSEEGANKYTRALIEFKSGGQLFFNDLRKFGYLKLVNAAELEKLLQNNYGPEPLTAAFSLNFLRGILRKKTGKIKALLLNQKLIAGLGNIYADEVLWAARINPERPAESLQKAEIKRLWVAINRIIKQAIQQRGTTFNNYVDSRGQKGNFSGFLKAYGRQGEKCPRCRELLIKKKLAGRGTHYCPHCQKLA